MNTIEREQNKAAINEEWLKNIGLLSEPKKANTFFQWLSKNKKIVISFFLIATIPFAIQFMLILSNYINVKTNININAFEIGNKEWFSFWGSYIAGAITLFGVLFSIRHAQNIHVHQIITSQIEAEKEHIAEAVSKIESSICSSFYNEFIGLPITNQGYDAAQIGNLKSRIGNKMSEINSLSIRITASTKIFDSINNCENCKKKCNLIKVKPEFQKIFSASQLSIYNTLKALEEYIFQKDRNIIIDNIVKQMEFENTLAASSVKYSQSQILDVMAKHKEVDEWQIDLVEQIDELLKISETAIPKLITLLKYYYEERLYLADKNCFK